jgi:hypothetical protein
MVLSLIFLKIFEALDPVAVGIFGVIAGIALAGRQILGLEKELEERRERKAAKRQRRL